MEQDNFNPERLLAELRELDEHPRIEAKQAREIGGSVMQTVCAFANESGLGGGYLLLGVREPDEQHQQFWLEGVENPDVLLNTLQTNCRDQFEVPVPVRGKPSCLKASACWWFLYLSSSPPPNPAFSRVNLTVKTSGKPVLGGEG